MAMGGGSIEGLRDLRGPMTGVLEKIAGQLAELEQFKARYGERVQDVEDGSETEDE